VTTNKVTLPPECVARQTAWARDLYEKTPPEGRRLLPEITTKTLRRKGWTESQKEVGRLHRKLFREWLKEDGLAAKG
jgi:hypothetical protein